MTNPKFISLVLFLVSGISGHCSKDITDTTHFSIEELQADWDFWKEKLQSIHPILYQYNSPEEFDMHFDSVRNLINRPMTQIEFYQLIAASNAFIKCAHTQIRPSVSMDKTIIRDSSVIPVDIRWFGEEAYITYNYTTNQNLDPGTKIKAINLVDADQIYQRVKQLIPRDGYNVQYARHWVNQSFYYYYHLLYGMSPKYTFTIEYQNNLTEVQVNGMSIPEMNKVIKNSPPASLQKSDGITFHFVDSLNAAYLHLGSFSDEDVKRKNGTKFEKYVDLIFEKIDSSNVSNLILDLQGNAGGSPNYSLYLLRYVMKEPFEFKAQIKKIKNPEASQMSKRAKETIFSDGTRGIFEPFKNAFQGNLYVLQDGGTISAGTEFTYVIRRYNRGPIIGEESGGNPQIMTGYWFFSGKKTLPNTQLRYGVAHRTVIMKKDFVDTGRGLIPDHNVIPTIHDYLSGYDCALHYTTKLIAKEKLRTTN